MVRKSLFVNSSITYSASENDHKWLPLLTCFPTLLPWHTIYLKHAAPLHVYFQWRRKNQGISVKLGMCLLFAARNCQCGIYVANLGKNANSTQTLGSLWTLVLGVIFTLRGERPSFVRLACQICQCPMILSCKYGMSQISLLSNSNIYGPLAIQHIGTWFETLPFESAFFFGA